VTISGHPPAIGLYNYLPEMTSVDLEKALVPIHKQLIKRNGGQITSILLVREIFTKEIDAKFPPLLLISLLRNASNDFPKSSEVISGR
jgi:hypothetical protein